MCTYRFEVKVLKSIYKDRCVGIDNQVHVFRGKSLVLYSDIGFECVGYVHYSLKMF